MAVKILDVELSDEQYSQLLDIGERNHVKQFIKPQLIHFKKNGWLALNKEWYDLEAQRCFLTEN